MSVCNHVGNDTLDRSPLSVDLEVGCFGGCVTPGENDFLDFEACGENTRTFGTCTSTKLFHRTTSNMIESNSSDVEVLLNLFDKSPGKELGRTGTLRTTKAVLLQVEAS